MYVIFPVEVLLDVPAQPPSAPAALRSQSVPPVPLAQSEQCEPPVQSVTTDQSVPPERVSSERAPVTASDPPPPPPPPRTREPAAMAGESGALRDISPAAADLLRTYSGVSFKLVKAVSDFSQQLSQINEQHAEKLQLLVETYRKRNSELRNERPPCSSSLFQTWESLLQEVESDSQMHADIATVYGRQVSRAIVEKSFHRKIQSKKIFMHKESYEAILLKTDEMLQKCHRVYSDAYRSHVSSPSNATLAAYFDAHNAYVQQLHAANAMVSEFNGSTHPQLLQELEEVQSDVTSIIADSLLLAADLVTCKTVERSRRYESLCTLARGVSSRADVTALLRHAELVPAASSVNGRPALTPFVPPKPPADSKLGAVQDGPAAVTQLRDELVLDRLASLSLHSRYGALQREAVELDTKIRQLQDCVDSLVRLQQRSLESNLFNKSNELQEEISSKRLDLQVAQIHYAAVKAQRDLFASKVETADGGRERRTSSSERAGMKTKWLKAFKSLKSSGFNKDSGQDRRNGREGREGSRPPDGPAASSLPVGAHWFQEYTYKKITACDACNQILRGHTRQGLKCRLCKMNVHGDCQTNVPRCQPKSRLLRRQKSTSELETRFIEGAEDPTGAEATDPVYDLLKQAAAKRKESSLPPPTPVIREHDADPNYLPLSRPTDPAGFRTSNHGSANDLQASSTSSSSQLSRRQGSTPRTLNPPPASLGRGASSSSARTYRMSAIALSLVALERAQRRSRAAKPASMSLDQVDDLTRAKLGRRLVAYSEPCTRSTSPAIGHAPSSPVHNRRLLSARTMRMSSLDLPDENEKSQSSASTSPCPSPQKPHRLLPTSLYVVLYNFASRHQDELDLKAGYKLTVMDTSDPDWWKGKCLGKVGFFPSKYITKLQAGERPLQVTHNLQVTDGQDGMRLLRDQIVIQIGEEVDGMIMIRDGENRQGACPLKYLTEV
ncbi:uncharacterized protein LOC122379073 isoform X4 [Amphibalanus amphitrite]|uniref:uncharacterized protein LOC122379073 isoform X4 n=1 Tax=Amphibalanus amphitrite TaxID=1232801 RepID=UPI001C91A8AF|nr:uncharacterized protein LOC122379073 isoform X4 [Amphibalanus amphitrite]